MAPRGKGTLYVVGTPIGNLSDMSVRAIDTLRNADKILCEDTRRTKQLLNHFEIHGARLESYHMHNEYQRTSSVISELLRGQQVALVSDAGMPGINDPGALVIKEAVRHEDDIDVVPIPGPSAFLAALVGSGLLEDSFQYCGFVAAKRWVLKSRSTNLWAPKPRSRPKPSCSRAVVRTRSLPSPSPSASALSFARSQRLKQFEGLKQHAHALVFYVSPHALVESLKDAVEVFGAARRCCLARELTKLHEEFIRGTLEEVSAMHEGDAGRKPRGEYSIVIEGMQQGGEDAVTEELILKCLEAVGF